MKNPKKFNIYNLKDKKEHIRIFSYVFKVLGDPIRLNIIKEIAECPGISGKEILINLKLSQPSLSFHLKQLCSAKIIKYHKEGQTHCYHIDFDTAKWYEKCVIEGIKEMYHLLLKFKNKKSQ